MAAKHISLVLGGARSGKSRFAEGLVTAHPGPWVYVATAEALDDEMQVRIDTHQERRGENWRTVDSPRGVPKAIMTAPPDAPVLVDCLTLWLSNLMLAEMNVEASTAALAHALSQATGPVVLVANEVGLGIVPDNALARRFRDAAGVLNQRVAELADEVWFVAAGLPLKMK